MLFGRGFNWFFDYFVTEILKFSVLLFYVFDFKPIINFKEARRNLDSAGDQLLASCLDMSRCQQGRNVKK